MLIILHNICEVHGKVFVNAWMNDLPDGTEEPHSSATHEAIESVSHDAKAIQLALVKHFSKEFLHFD